MNEQIYRCRACNAGLEFNPEKQNLTCPYCGEVQTLDDLIKPSIQVELDFQKAQESFDLLSTEEIRVVHCSNCGGESTFAPNVEAGECDFCSAKIVVTGPSNKAMKPQYLLPFLIGKTAAEDTFRHWISKRWFAPNGLKKFARLENPLKGIYFPFWTFDTDTESVYRGERGNYYTVQVQSKDSAGNTVTRSETRIRWTPVSGRVSRVFDDVLVAASKSLPSELTTKLNAWDLKELVEYNPAVLSGFKAETYSETLSQGFAEAKVKIDREIYRDVCADIGGDVQRVHSLESSYHAVTFKYVLLPVWTLVYRFRNKIFQVLINGRNGEISGKRPYSVIKITLLVLLVLGLGVGVYFLLKTLGYLET